MAQRRALGQNLVLASDQVPPQRLESLAEHRLGVDQPLQRAVVVTVSLLLRRKMTSGRTRVYQLSTEARLVHLLHNGYNATRAPLALFHLIAKPSEVIFKQQHPYQRDKYDAG
jgi:hypothetical protein